MLRRSFPGNRYAIVLTTANMNVLTILKLNFVFCQNNSTYYKGRYTNEPTAGINNVYINERNIIKSKQSALLVTLLYKVQRMILIWEMATSATDHFLLLPEWFSGRFAERLIYIPNFIEPSKNFPQDELIRRAQRLLNLWFALNINRKNFFSTLMNYAKSQLWDGGFPQTKKEME